MRIEVVPMRPGHIDEVARLETLCFSCPWSRSMIRSELENPTARYFAAESDGQLIGYAGVQIVLDEGYITNIASRPDMRRQGVGNALLEALADLARKKDLSFLTLEVRLSNAPAIALYTRHDFVPVGVRKNYYHKPAEDALLMTLFLKGEAP